MSIEVETVSTIRDPFDQSLWYWVRLVDDWPGSLAEELGLEDDDA